MPEQESIKWDVKRGYGVYKSVYAEELQRWIREGRIKREEVFVWTSGMSGWRRPEDLDEFRKIFEKLEKKKKEKRERKKKVPSVSKRRKTKKKPKLAIIDDEKEICWLLEKGLRKRRFHVSSSHTGRGGLDMVKRERPDIVLLDLRLSDMDGLNVLRKIKKLRPKKKVVVISAYGDAPVKKKAATLGANAFVDKPFMPKDVINVIKKVA